MASPAAAKSSCCPFKHCVCRWRSECSPGIPRVAPDREYSCVPAGALDDESPAWSVLVGVVSGVTVSSLGLHRFRVARSGRVLGRSNDALETVAGDVDFKAEKSNSSSVRATAAAARSPDGRSLSLCLFSRETDLSSDLEKVDPPRPLVLHLDLDDDETRIAAVSALPDLPIGPLMPTCPVSVAGELWAPYLTNINGPSDLVMQRLDAAAGGEWVEVGGRFHLPKGIPRDLRSYAAVIQGAAVVGRTTILLSLYPSRRFDCSTLAWNAVATAPEMPYEPIHGRGAYVEEDDAVHFFHWQSIYSNKLCCLPLG